MARPVPQDAPTRRPRVVTMTPEQFARVEQLFEAAHQLAEPQRGRFLAAHAADDPEVAAAVHALLVEDARALAGTKVVGARLASLRRLIADGADAPAARPVASEEPGAEIGPYKLLQRLGEGGFGEVFLAQQKEPVVRQVALKLLKRGMDTRQVVARFEQERQALALMDHPNIARVLDAGTTITGRPYFAMDLVQGQPIVAYCDQNRLTIDERLELFVQVCRAVQHAHGKGIIHRDLKPPNVLVGQQDGKARVKVIDFGIAKALGSKLTDKSLFTEQHQVVGTLQYMSPEQAEGSLDIDTRTDVYALGVMLYELLVGSTPFAGSGYADLHRMRRDDDAPRPSTRASSSATSGEIAARRRVQPAQLGALIRGELDWIAMKAIEKDRARRYDSAGALALDVERYRAGEPVTAVPPSASYRLRKFVRRYRVQVVAAGLVTVALVLGFVSTAWQAKVASEQARAARAAEADANAARDAEKARADQLEQVSAFQEKMLAQVDPTLAGVRLTEDVAQRFATALVQASVPEAERADLTDAFRRHWARVNATDAAAAMIDRTILRPAVAAIDEQFQDQPAVDAQLRQALADVYRTIGLHDTAMPLQVSALATRRLVLGQEHPSTLFSIARMGVLLLEQGKLVDAELCMREALAKHRVVLGDDHPKTLECMNLIGPLLRRAGKLAEAEPYYFESLAKHRVVLGDEHSDTLVAVNNVGGLLRSQGKLAAAEPYYREALATRRRVLGEAHPDTLFSINNLGGLLRDQGKLEEAEAHVREALEKRRRVLGEEHPNTLESLNSVASTLQEQSRLAEAEPYYREALAKRRRVLGEDHPLTFESLNNMGFLLRARGKVVEADPYYREALAKRRRVLGEEHPDTLVSVNNLAGLLVALGRLAEAEPYFRDAAEKSRRVQGEQHPFTLICTVNLGRVLQRQARHQEAIDLLAPIEAAARSGFSGGSAPRLAVFLATLGRARVGLGFAAERFALAEANFLETHRILVGARGATHKDTLECVQDLTDLCTAWDKAEPGKGYDGKAAEWKAKLAGGAVGTQK